MSCHEWMTWLFSSLRAPDPLCGRFVFRKSRHPVIANEVKQSRLRNGVRRKRLRALKQRATSFAMTKVYVAADAAWRPGGGDRLLPWLTPMGYPMPPLSRLWEAVRAQGVGGGWGSGSKGGRDLAKRVVHSLSNTQTERPKGLRNGMFEGGDGDQRPMRFFLLE